jgi:hypothetical protein
MPAESGSPTCHPVSQNKLPIALEAGIEKMNKRRLGRHNLRCGGKLSRKADPGRCADCYAVATRDERRSAPPPNAGAEEEDSL